MYFGVPKIIKICGCAKMAYFGVPESISKPKKNIGSTKSCKKSKSELKNKPMPKILSALKQGLIDTVFEDGS